MNEVAPTPLVIDAPAKLNLGLEVLGRRPDGYHDLASIFLTVSLCDRLTFSQSAQPRIESDTAELTENENLIARALAALRPQTDFPSVSVALRKRIPIASGLGGASSDAAATLLAARQLWQLPLSDHKLAELGADIGSDVPFFLHGGCALGRGRGNLLDSLPLPRDVWFVVVAPRVRIPSKTATLYARLAPYDFGDGSQIASQAERLRSGRNLNPALLSNSFERPLYQLAPDLAHLSIAMRDAGATSTAITGAGPAHYAIFDDATLAQRVAGRLRARLGTTTRVFVVAPVPARSD